MLIKSNDTELIFHLEKLKIMTTNVLKRKKKEKKKMAIDMEIAEREGRKVTEVTAGQ